MATELDHSSGIPLYRQIMNILRTEIMAGAVSAEEPLTEAKLEARFGVSLAPIKQALKELSIEGVVLRKQGRGTFPAPTSAVERPADLKAGDLYRFLADRGLKPTSYVRDIEKVAPPERIAARLGLPTGKQIVHFTRVIEVDEKPFAENDIYIAGPATFVPTVDELKDGGSALHLLEQRHGIFLDHAEHEAWASSANTHQAEALGVSVGAPVLIIDTVFYARGGEAVGWRSAVHLPDEFKFHFVTQQ